MSSLMSRLIKVRLAFICAAAFAALGSIAADQPEPTAPGSGVLSPTEPKAVKVTTRREGEVTHFIVENMEHCEVTMTFELELHQLQAKVNFPYTATFPARQVTEAFVLEPTEPGAKWEYSFTNYFKLGSNCVKHDDSAIYQLPYLPGKKYTVTQGYNGDFSHTGANQFAIDWKMPEGTVVCATRGGTVVKIKEDSETGGSSIKFDKFNNYVLIRHDDGTLAHYCHLQKNGVIVKVGEVVRAGEPIAHSGNTGFSSGPHLHFCVFKAKTGRERESIPVRFRTAEGYETTLVESRRYKAVAPPSLAIGDARPLDKRAVGQAATP